MRKLCRGETGMQKRLDHALCVAASPWAGSSGGSQESRPLTNRRYWLLLLRAAVDNDAASPQLRGIIPAITLARLVVVDDIA